MIEFDFFLQVSGKITKDRAVWAQFNIKKTRLRGSLFEPTQSARSELPNLWLQGHMWPQIVNKIVFALFLQIW